jgi:hypothetical protein
VHLNKTSELWHKNMSKLFQAVSSCNEVQLDKNKILRNHHSLVITSALRCSIHALCEVLCCSLAQRQHITHGSTPALCYFVLTRYPQPHMAPDRLRLETDLHYFYTRWQCISFRCCCSLRWKLKTNKHAGLLFLRRLCRDFIFSVAFTTVYNLLMSLQHQTRL